MENKKGSSFLYQVIIHIILVALIFGMFFAASAYRVNSKAVKQQVLEKQLALMIDSSVPGMELSVNKINIQRPRNEIDSIDKIEVKDSKIFAYVNGQKYSKGYPYFSRYDVSVKFDKEGAGKWVVKIG